MGLAPKIALISAVCLGVWFAARFLQPHHVGDSGPEGTLVPTGRFVVSTGPTVDLKSAVVDCVITADQTMAVVKSSDAVAVVSLADGAKLSEQQIHGGSSLTGIALSPDGHAVACGNSVNDILLFSLSNGILSPGSAIHLPEAKIGGPSYPCGLQFLDDDHLLVAANRDNSVLLVDLTAGKTTRRIPVDTAPFAILNADSSHVFVTCWSAPNQPGAPTAPSAGSQVQVDKRGVAVAGSLCEVDLRTNSVIRRRLLPLQPTEMVSGAGKLFVACANGDSVLELDAATLGTMATIKAGPLSGSAPDSLAWNSDERTLFVAFGGLDRIGAYDLATGAWKGFMRTGWYPTMIRSTPAGLIVGTAKGLGSVASKGPKHSVFDLTSSVSVIAKPDFSAPLPPEALDGEARPGAPAVPIPVRTGEPSLIKHVVYVIKENRTYDQILGDMKEGNGDADLTIYGESVTPNEHAIARGFVLLDNYYCNGVVSADGHAWATEANATTYYEHTRGGWTRSYPFGDDPLATSASGYIWDNAIDHGCTVRNFGEFDYAKTNADETGFSVLAGFLAGKHEEFGQNIGVARLRDQSMRDYPGWNLAIPDVLRADRFVRALRGLEKKGGMADLTIIYLPQDHTAGGSKGYPSPRAQVADNDLGVGRVLEALSHSKFWPTTVAFIEEDDPQDGFDHVSGYRSVCLVAGPYVRRGVTVSHFYNQASVIHTMERILDLPPMNVNDAEAPVMTDCFQPVADLRPYAATPNRIPLDERLPKSEAVAFDLRKPDQVDDDLFNRQLWKLAGKAAPYPAK